MLFQPAISTGCAVTPGDDRE